MIDCPEVSLLALRTLAAHYGAQLRAFQATITCEATAVAIATACPRLTLFGASAEPNSPETEPFSVAAVLQIAGACPWLRKLRVPWNIGDDEHETVRRLLRTCPGLEDVGVLNVDYYRGLQYV